MAETRLTLNRIVLNNKLERSLFNKENKENNLKRFKNISLIYECDHATLERAALLAKENHARLTIVHVIKELPSSLQHVYVDDQPMDLTKLIMDDLQERLAKIANSARSFGVRPKTLLLEGQPVVEIVRDVVENHRDLVIITVDKKPGWKEFFFGNAVSAMMRNCPCPLLALKPTEHKGFKKILVAIDPVLVGDAHDTLNNVILELASSLAELENAELHVVHAWRLMGESMMRGRFAIPSADVDRAVLHEFGRHRKLLEDAIEKYSIPTEHVHLPKADPVQAITSLVNELDIDLLVMGTVCRTGIPGLLIGNTAEQVLSAVECSTLTVKPEGFVSPIVSKTPSTHG